MEAVKESDRLEPADREERQERSEGPSYRGPNWSSRSTVTHMPPAADEFADGEQPHSLLDGPGLA
jgi:hypothetical protein